MVNDKEFPSASGRIKDADRDLLLKVLASMGIELPPKSKMPADALDKKLSKALNYSQRFAKNLTKLPFDPTSLPKWKDVSEITVRKGINRGNFTEAAMYKIAEMTGGSNPIPLYTNVFMDMRQSLMCIGDNFDKGHRIVILQDKASQSAIIMRMIDVLHLSPIVPVIVVSYDHATRSNGSLRMLQVAATLPKEQRWTGQIICTIEEQKILLKLLRMNAKHLSPSYKPKLHEIEKSCELSFILPLGPLTSHDIGALTHNTGCVACGEDTKMRCSNCLVQTYCSKDCQRLDWAQHKSMCKALTGGEWTTLTFKHLTIPHPPGSEVTLINRLSSIDEIMDNNTYYVDTSTTEVPPNIHGTHPFLIKIQQSIGGFDMLIYDRTRSFQVHCTPTEDPQNVIRISDLISNSPTLGKIYRWAKRIGDYQLSVCFDRAPPQIPTW